MIKGGREQERKREGKREKRGEREKETWSGAGRLLSSGSLSRGSKWLALGQAQARSLSRDCLVDAGPQAVEPFSAAPLPHQWRAGPESG